MLFILNYSWRKINGKDSIEFVTLFFINTWRNIDEHCLTRHVAVFHLICNSIPPYRKRLINISRTCAYIFISFTSDLSTYLGATRSPAVGVGGGVCQHCHWTQPPNRARKDRVKIFIDFYQEPDVDALGKANSNISSGLVIVCAAIAKDLDVDPGQLLVLVHRGLVLGQVGEPLAYRLQVALQVQDNAHL